MPIARIAIRFHKSQKEAVLKKNGRVPRFYSMLCFLWVTFTQSFLRVTLEVKFQFTVCLFVFSENGESVLGCILKTFGHACVHIAKLSAPSGKKRSIREIPWYQVNMYGMSTFTSLQEMATTPLEKHVTKMP